MIRLSPLDRLRLASAIRRRAEGGTDVSVAQAWRAADRWHRAERRREAAAAPRPVRG